MTATPRIYDDGSKSQAAEGSAVLASMDDEALYGKSCTGSASARQ
jgi:predicted helicase